MRFPGEGQSNREPITQRRAVRARGGLVRPPGRAPLPHRGQLRVRLRLLPLHARPPTRWRSGELRDGGTLHMLRVKGVTNAHLEGNQVAGHRVRRRVGRDRPAGRPVPLHARARRADERTTTALVHVSRQGWAQGAAYFSRLEGQVYSKGSRLLHLHPGRRRGRARHHRRRRDRLRQRHRPGVGLRHPRGRSCAWSSSRPSAATLDFPDNITTSNRGHAGGLRGQHQRQLHPRSLPDGRSLGHRPQPAHQQTGDNRFERRVRRIHVQPRRPDALREHPGLGRDDVRDLGSLGADRGLACARCTLVAPGRSH